MQELICSGVSRIPKKHILNQAANIDKPRKYDFQKENVNEEDFLRSMSGLLPNGFFGMRETPEQISSCIAGEVKLTFSGSRDYKCYDCAQPLALSLEGNNLHLSCKNVCENNSEFFVDIDFPTGEVVFGDWPDRFSEIKDEGWLDECDHGESINYIKGQRQRCEGFAKQGIFHLSVGNTCPSLFYNEATAAIQIGNEHTVPDEEDEDDDGEGIIPEGFTKLGYFCTDLWWVTMLDKSRYEEMLSKLPGERSKGYYAKKLDVATVKPGRYRFHAVPRKLGDDGDYGNVFATAEYLGPCGEIPKVKHVTEDTVMLTPRQYTIKSAARYPTLYSGQFEEIRFQVMDQLFNVLGNGIRSKGEFLTHISVPMGTELSDELPPENGEKPKHMEGYVRAPYPNFKAEYSILNQLPMDVLTDEWLKEIQWFYTECRNFFEGPNVGHYSYAYPSSGKTPMNTVAEQEKHFERFRKEGQTEEEFNAIITKQWECEYTGDTDDFLKRRWAKELAKVKSFITKTLRKVDTELTIRDVVR